MKYQVEHTDTFAGEANYSWVNRAVIEAPDDASDALLVRRAKAALGIKGRHRKTSYGDVIQLDYPSACVRTFISWIDESEEE